MAERIRWGEFKGKPSCQAILIGCNQTYAEDLLCQEIGVLLEQRQRAGTVMPEKPQGQGGG